MNNNTVEPKSLNIFTNSEIKSRSSLASFANPNPPEPAFKMHPSSTEKPAPGEIFNSIDQHNQYQPKQLKIFQRSLNFRMNAFREPFAKSKTLLNNDYAYNESINAGRNSKRDSEEDQESTRVGEEQSVLPKSTRNEEEAPSKARRRRDGRRVSKHQARVQKSREGATRDRRKWLFGKFKKSCSISKTKDSCAWQYKACGSHSGRERQSRVDWKSKRIGKPRFARRGEVFDFKKGYLNVCCMLLEKAIRRKCDRLVFGAWVEVLRAAQGAGRGPGAGGSAAEVGNGAEEDVKKNMTTGEPDGARRKADTVNVSTQDHIESVENKEQMGDKDGADKEIQNAKKSENEKTGIFGQTGEMDEAVETGANEQKNPEQDRVSKKDNMIAKIRNIFTSCPEADKDADDDTGRVGDFSPNVFKDSGPKLHAFVNFEARSPVPAQKLGLHSKPAQNYNFSFNVNQSINKAESIACALDPAREQRGSLIHNLMDLRDKREKTAANPFFKENPRDSKQASSAEEKANFLFETFCEDQNKREKRSPKLVKRQAKQQSRSKAKASRPKKGGRGSQSKRPEAAKKKPKVKKRTLNSKKPPKSKRLFELRKFRAMCGAKSPAQKASQLKFIRSSISSLNVTPRLMRSNTGKSGWKPLSPSPYLESGKRASRRGEDKARRRRKGEPEEASRKRRKTGKRATNETGKKPVANQLFFSTNYKNRDNLRISGDFGKGKGSTNTFVFNFNRIESVKKGQV